MTTIEIVKEWFRYASNDLISAKHLFYNIHPKQIEISSYLCQQSAEKALKGYLIYKEIEPPKTHDLILLYRLCVKLDETFKEIAGYCADITNYGIPARYPFEIVLDETITKSAIRKAETIYQFCQSKIQELKDNPM
jgi:HEPN domain-containing protein